MLKLVIGNKNYSSWSVRPWLALKKTGAPFEEILIGLDQPDTDAQIRRYSPSGKVPCLIDGDTVVWDSLAICEYLNEKFPGAQLWPKDPADRARARSVAAEMHSGFANLRSDCGMKMREVFPYKKPRAETQADIDRVIQLWEECLRLSGGPYLFGKEFTIADAFFGPVVSRFRTYSIPVHGAAKAYTEAIWATASMMEWLAAAKAETLRVPRYE